MRDDSPLLTFDIKQGRVDLHATTGLPFLLRNEQSLERLIMFLEKRLPVTYRRDYREICMSAGICPADTAEWQRRTHCLSIDDDFWVRPIGSQINHDEVDPRIKKRND